MISTIIEFRLLGGAIAFLTFNGFQVSTPNGSSFSPVVFDFAVTGGLLVQCLVTAVNIGRIGGFLHAARLRLEQALRELWTHRCKSSGTIESS